MHLSFRLLVLLLAASATCAEETSKPAVSAQSPEVSRPLPVEYKLGPDSLHQEGVPEGKLEGPFLFKSQISEVEKSELPPHFCISAV